MEGNINPTIIMIGNILVDKKTGALLKVNNINEDGCSCKVVNREKYPLPDGWSAEGFKLNKDVLTLLGFEEVSRSHPSGSSDPLAVEIWLSNDGISFYYDEEDESISFATYTRYDGYGFKSGYEISYVHEIQNLFTSLRRRPLDMTNFLERYQ